MIFGGITIVYILLGILTYLAFNNLDKWAKIGDFFGTINVLFATLVFGELIYSIWIQRKDLDKILNKFEENSST